MKCKDRNLFVNMKSKIDFFYKVKIIVWQLVNYINDSIGKMPS